MYKVYLSFGSNIGSKKENILKAYYLIECNEIGKLLKKSSFYITPPFGFESNDDFYNTVVLIETILSPLELLRKLKEIEVLMGRVNKKSTIYESRIIDIDIIDFNGEVFHSDLLQIPHKEIEKRDFVLFPLKEIEPRWKHPISKIKIETLVNSMVSPLIDKS